MVPASLKCLTLHYITLPAKLLWWCACRYLLYWMLWL